MLAAAPGDVVRQFQILRSLGADQRGIIPGKFRDRFRQFLEPAIIGEASIVDTGIGPEEELDFIKRARLRRRKARGVELQRDIDGRGR